MRRLAIVTVLVCMGLARPARADLASSIYGDVQDVVQELIETEVTTSVVAKLKGQSPALGFYMSGTLERLASPYWGSLGRTLKADLTVMISDFLYWHMTLDPKVIDRDIVNSARRFFQCASGMGQPEEKEMCTRILDAVTVKKRPLVEYECRREEIASDHRVACSVALALKAALEGRKEVRHHVIDALTNIVLGEIGNDRVLLALAQGLLTRWLDPKGTLPEVLFDAMGTPEMRDKLADDAIEAMCGKQVPRPTSEQLTSTDPRIAAPAKLQLDAFRAQVTLARATMMQFMDDPLRPGWICAAITSANARAVFEVGMIVREDHFIPRSTSNALDPNPEYIGGGQMRTTLDFATVENVLLALGDPDKVTVTDDMVFRALVDQTLSKMCPKAEKDKPGEPKAPGGDDAQQPDTQGNVCGGVKVGNNAYVNVYMFNWNYSAIVKNGQFEIAGTKKLAATAVKAMRALRKIRELKSLVPYQLQKFVFSDTPQAAASKTLRAVSQMMQLVSALRNRWYLWQSDSQEIAELDIFELLQVAQKTLGANGRNIPSLKFLDDNIADAKSIIADAKVKIGDAKAVISDAKAKVGDAKAKIDDVKGQIDDAKAQIGDAKVEIRDAIHGEIEAGKPVIGAATLDIQDWFRYIVRADFRSLAMESLRAALHLRLGDQSRAAETFFMTLASYLLDAGDGGVGETVARSAFKASAKELLLQSSTRGVPRLGDRSRVNLFPRVALRLAFNQSFAVSSNDTRRNGLSVDWPTAMYAFTDYAGVEVSVLDLAAPLAELALRDPVSYSHAGNIAADIVRPRLGLFVAVPALSRRIALDVGVGMRLLETEVTERDAMGVATKADYKVGASFLADIGVQFVF